MIIRISCSDISGNESTRLTASASDGGTSLTVQNTEGFTADEYIVVGKLGEEKTEIRKIGSVTPDVTLTIDALLFDHAINTPVTYIGFNQIKVYSSTSKTGIYTELTSQASGDSSPKAIEPDQEFTEFNHALGATTTWYKVKYYNSTSAVSSTLSDPVQGIGYVTNSVRMIIDRASTNANDRNHKIMTENEKLEVLNVGYQNIINRLIKSDRKRFLKKGYVDIKNSYNTGTISVSDASTSVTGSSTVWVTSWTGKKIYFGDEGFPYEVSSIDSATALTLTVAYKGDGDDLSGETYKIFQDEYDIYEESTGAVVADFKRIEKVYDEDGNEVGEYDLHRSEDGYYLKRQGGSLKFCLNYYPSTSGNEGRWTVWFVYMPAKLDSMADEPELPEGYSGILDLYLEGKILELGDKTTQGKAKLNEFNNAISKMLGESIPRTNKTRGWRIDRNLRPSTEHDSDWGTESLWGRKTIGT